MKKLVILLSLLVTFNSYAEPNNFRAPKNEFRNKQTGGFFQQLNLSPEQKEKMQAMQQKRQELGKKMQELGTKRQELTGMLKDPNQSESAIQSKLAEVNFLFTEINTSRISSILEIRKTLNPQQLSMILDKMEQKRGPNQEPDNQFKPSGNLREPQGPGDLKQNKSKDYGKQKFFRQPNQKMYRK